MKLYAVVFLTYLKPLILSTIRSYYRNYTDTGSVVFLCSGLKAILKAEHSMLKVFDMHSHNIRYASNFNFHVPRVRSNYGKHIFKFAVSKTWEEIPTRIKTLGYHKFKKEYERILVNSER